MARFISRFRRRRRKQRLCQGGTRCPQRFGRVSPKASGPTFGLRRISDGIVFREADPPFLKRDGYLYLSSSFTSPNAFTANSKSSRECAAETWVRIRAVPCGTTG